MFEEYICKTQNIYRNLRCYHCAWTVTCKGQPIKPNKDRSLFLLRKQDFAFPESFRPKKASEN